MVVSNLDRHIRSVVYDIAAPFIAELLARIDDCPTCSVAPRRWCPRCRSMAEAVLTHYQCYTPGEPLPACVADMRHGGLIPRHHRELSIGERYG